jgi:sugar phosphate permease
LSTLYHCGTADSEQLNREFKMSFKKATVAAILAVSMASTPVLAQSAASLSVARSGAETTDENDLRGGFIIPLVAVVAIILGIIAATGGKDRPSSP